MPKPIQFKKLLLLMLLSSSSTNVFSEQNQYNYIDNQWQNSRYIDHTNGTVTDTKTALMWKQCPEGLGGSGCTTNIAENHTYTWKEAIEQAKEKVNKPFAGHSDWRLPNIKELVSLVARDRSEPAINSILFPNTPNYNFWSSSPVASYASKSWMLDFNSGYDTYVNYYGDGVTDNRNNKLHVRLVRGAE